MATTFEGLKACAEKFLSEIPDLPKFEDSDVICDQPHEPLAPPDATANLEQLFSTSPQADTSASSEDQQQISTQPDQLSATFQETCTDDEQIACSKSDKPEPTEAAKCTLTLDEATKVRNLGQLKEIISIPPVTLSYWEQFIDWLRRTFTRSGLQEAESGSCDSQQEGDSVSPAVASKASESRGKKKKYKYQSDTDMPISDLKNHIMTGSDHYSRDIKPYVVQYFFNEYRKRTEKKLMQFESEFGDRIAERLVQLHKLADQLDGLHEEIGELEVIIDHLRRMTEHLEEKAEIFRKTMVFSEI